MLVTLRVSAFAIIDDLELEFGPGFTVITGETGAGKSILFDALGLLLGERADSAQVRDQAKKAELTAEFSLENHPAAARWLDEYDLGADGELWLRRTINSDGRSRAYINGTPVTLQQLSSLGSLLVAIHGQHAHQNLLKPREQLALLDEFGVDPRQRQRMREAYQLWHAALEELRRLEENRNGDPEQVQLLQFQIEELEKVGAQASQYQQLRQDHERMSHAGELLELVREGEQRLDGDDEPSVRAHLGVLIQQLEQYVEVAPELAETRKMLDEARINVEESLSLLRHFSDQLELDPAQFQEADRTMGRLHELARKYHCKPEQLPQMLVQLRQRLETLENLDIQRQQQQIRVDAAHNEALNVASDLSDMRRKQATRLAKKTQALIRQMGMDQANLKIQINTTDKQRLSASGIDQVEFLLAANPGSAPAPLRKIASGGELSRCALALMVAAQNKGGPPSLIFDEVDAGVGGETAKSVGQLLAKVANGRQALCVTHLAQIAAGADRHLQVSKQVHKGKTLTRWQSLQQQDQITELARMLGGTDSATAIAHAKELLKEARTRD